MGSRGRTKLVLERLLARGERGADLVLRLLARRRAELGLQLRLERPLLLHHQLRPHVAPRRVLGRLDAHLGPAEVTDLYLALHLGLHEGQNALVQRLRDLDQPSENVQEETYVSMSIVFVGVGVGVGDLLRHHGDLSHLPQEVHLSVIKTLRARSGT